MEKPANLVPILSVETLLEDAPLSTSELTIRKLRLSLASGSCVARIDPEIASCKMFVAPMKSLQTEYILANL